MIGVISGDNLGAALSTLAGGGATTLAGGADAGNAAVAAGINVANGNLVLQATDDFVAGVGLPVDVLRTYNSQGGAGGGADWSYSVQNQTARLVGTQNADGSTIVLTHADGSQAIYTYSDAQHAYLAEDGADAGSSIVVANGQMVRTDAATQASETYSQASGQLLSSTDANGNTLTYSYSGTGKLASIENASGEGSTFDYDANDRLIDVRTVTSNGASLVSTVQTSYAYDDSGRLSTVTVDLQTPDADGSTSFTTTYAYDGTSDRVSSVSQSNGTSTSFSYVEVDGSYRVSQVTSGSVSTSFTYDLANGVTSVTDGNGNVTQYAYDSTGNVTQITLPPDTAGGTSPVLQYTYDAAGQVTSATDGDGNQTTYTYDADENLLSTVDSLGNSVTNTWSSSDQLLTQTVATATSGASGQGPATTRYVYDASGQRTFDISATGDVTHYVYASDGELDSTISYSAAKYDVSQLASDQPLTLTELNAWLAGIDPSQAVRVDYAYDLRGQVSTKTVYGSLLADGTGDDATAITMAYVYSAQGQLLSTSDASGDTVHYTYDGAGRLLSATDAAGNTTTTAYDGSGRSVTVTNAGGLATISTYDAGGMLLSVSQFGDTTATTSYQYDANGNPAMVTDADGGQTFYVYDAQNRKVAEVDPTGDVVSYAYDAAGNLVSQTRYATAIDISTLVSDGQVKALTLAMVVPASTEADATSWNVYDADERLVATIDPSGTVTQTVYGLGGRVDEVVQYAEPVQTVNLSSPLTLASLDLQSSANDRVTRYFYDADGQKTGVLDADGDLTTYTYDDVGNLIGTTSYANPALQPAAASDDLAAYVPASSAADISTWSLYNAAGQQVGQLDADGYLTEYAYDSNGRLTSETAYATQVHYSPGMSLVAIRPASTASDQVTRTTYDADGRTASVTDSRGVVTQFTYDADGNVVSKMVGAGTAGARTTLYHYDKFGQVIAELSPVGAAQLTGDLTSDQIDAVWAQYAMTYAYDAAGRKTSETAPGGATTYYFYDAAGRLAGTVDPTGAVTQTTYDALGRVTGTTQFATAAAGVAAGGPASALASIVAQIADPSQDAVTSITYNTDGTRATDTDAVGTVTGYTYDAFGDVTSQTATPLTGQSVTTDFTYDRDGQQTQTISDPNGLAVTTSRQYDAFGRVVSATDGNGNTSAFSYDPNGAEIASTDAAGNTVATVYDAFGRTLATTDALGNRTTYAYAPDGSSMTVTTPEGISLVTDYDEFGEVTTVYDGDGNASSYRYDADGNRVETDSASGTTTATYDADDRAISTTDANGTVVQYTYDADSRVLSRTVDPDGLDLVTSYTYDALGRVATTTDPNGNVTTTVYDAAGEKLTQIVDADGPLALETDWTYDGLGHVTSVMDPNGTVTQYDYDALGRRTTQTVDPDGLALVTQYDYDANGNVIASISPDGNRTTYVYDADGQLRFTIDAAGDVSEADYDADGQVIKSVSYAQPIDLTALGSDPDVQDVVALIQPSSTDSISYRSYDADGKLIDAVDGTGAVTAYRYDAAGNVIETISYANRINVGALVAGSPIPQPVADPARDSDVHTVYDAANRAIFTMDATGAVVQLTYDGNGNVVRQIAYATPVPTNTPANAASIAQAVAAVADPSRDEETTRIFDAANRVVFSVNGVGTITQSTYDDNGNLTDSLTFAQQLPQGVDVLSAVSALEALKAQLGFKSTAPTPGDLPLLVLLAGGATPYGESGATLVQQAVSVMSELGLPASDQALGVAFQLVDVASTLLGSGPYTLADTLADAVPRLIALVQTITLDGGFDAMGGAYWSIQLISNALDEFDGGYGNQEYFPDDPENAPFQPGEDFATSVVAALTAMNYGQMPSAGAYEYQSIPDDTWPATLAYGVRNADGSSTDRETSYVYDDANRVTTMYDPNNIATSYTYDADGHVTQIVTRSGFGSGHLGYGAQSGSGGLPVGDGDGGGLGGLSSQRVTSFVYDAAGRQIYSVNANGAVTQTVYDAAGNVTASIQYANLLPLDASTGGGGPPGLPPGGLPGFPGLPSPVFAVASSSTSVITQAYIEANLVTNAAADRTTTQVYDQAGRVIYSVSSGGSVTQTRYDGAGRVIGTTAYANLVPVDANYTEQSLEAALVADPQQDRTSRFVYDASGNLLQGTDPTGATETYTYDGVGRKTSYTDKNGGTYLYAYDADGRMLSETDPSVAVTTVQTASDGSLTTQGASTIEVAIETGFTYDAFGNVLTQTEAVGTAQARTTTYTYDAAGHQIKVVYPAVGVYDPSQDNLVANGMNGNAVRTDDQNVSLYTETAYDAFGDAVANRDVAGNITHKVYDNDGNVIYDIDADGYVTEYVRDGFGQVSNEVRYAQQVGISDVAVMGGAIVNNPLSELVTITESQLAIQESDLDRSIKYSYDSMGNVVSATSGGAAASGFFYDSSASGYDQGMLADAQTETTYNAFGEVTQVQKLVNANYEEWATTASYYDQQGNVVATVDPLGYVTTMRYDANGNMTSQTQYANATTSWNADSFSVPQTSPQDRTTTYTYDADNRKTSVTQVGVSYTNASLSPVVGDLTTTYTYDAAGNQTSATDATGATTYTYYDALGRVTAIVSPAVGGAGGAQVLPLTIYYRDAYGNVVASVALSRGAASASLAGYGIAGGSGGWNSATLSGGDRWTLNEYDTHGNLIETTAAGNTTYRSYNAHGNLAKEWETVTAADGSQRTNFTAYEYDADGNVIQVITPASTSVLDAGISNLSSSSAQISYDEQGNPFISGTNSVSMSWSSLVNPNGGGVEIIVNYNTLSTATGVDGGGAVDESGFPVGGVPSVSTSHAQFFNASTVAGGATVSWAENAVTTGGISGINSIQILQQDASGRYQTVWQGTPGQANGSHIETVTQAQAGVDSSDMQYDAFGDLVSKGSNGGAQTYFTYDVNGNLVGTNANGGVDELFAYNMLGQQTAAIRSNGSYTVNASLHSAATSADEVDYDIDDDYLPYDWDAGQVSATITVYDMDGNAVQTIEPSPVTYSAGMSAQSGVATYSNVQSGNDESGFMQVSNSVQVSWGQSGGVGSPTVPTPGTGQVKVVLTYAESVSDESGSTGATQTVTQYFSAASVASGRATLTWNQDDAGQTSALGSVIGVSVYQQDASGNWVSLTDASAPSDSGLETSQYITVDAPQDPNATLVMQVSNPDGSTSTLQGDRIGDYMRFDMSQLPVGSVYVQLQYYGPGQPEAPVSQWIGVNVTGPSAGQSHNNATLDWWYQGEGSASLSATPVVSRTFDRWGNELSETDPRDAQWVTSYQYNAENKVVSETTPGPADGGEGGTTYTDYDADGREVASRDADGNTTYTVYDAAGNAVRTLQADGGVVNNTYDVFGDKTSTTDALGNETIMTFDDAGHQTATIAVLPGGAYQTRESATYDALGDKLTDTNGLGETTTYQYDLRGNVIATVTPMGDATRDAYDVNGHKVFEVDADNNDATWLYDYFGQLETNQDIGGAVYTYQYDNAGQLTGEQNTRGVSLQYTYDGAGHETQIRDNADNEVTSNTYDLAGNVVHEEVTKAGVVYEDEYLSYDANNRLRQVQDGNLDISIDYDANGNRTHLAARYTDGSAAGSDLYFGYNDMNEETVADAVDSNLDISATQGHILTYDLDGNRTSDTHGGLEYNAQGQVITGLVTEGYAYDSMNRLVQSTYNGVVTDVRTYDAADHVLTSGSNGSASQAYFNGLQIDASGQVNTYDADGELVTQTNYDADGKETDVVDYDRYDAAGNVLEYTETVPGSGGYTNTFDYDMVRYAGYQVADIRGTSTEFDSGETTYHYDANGALIGLTDATDGANNRTFVNDANGMILQKVQGSNVENEMIVDGQVLATTGTGTSNSSAAFVNVTNFDPSYQSVSNSFPAASPGEYTVQAGDTLQSIAQSAYGDSKLWYLIADANGLTSSASMKVGQTLTIPNRVTDVDNNASTYRPYSASSVIGNTSPNLPTPSDGGGGCGIIGEIIVDVVSVIATYYLGPIGGNLVMQLGNNITGEQHGFSVDSFLESVADQEFGEFGEIAAKSALTGHVDVDDIATAAVDAGLDYVSGGVLSSNSIFGSTMVDAVNQGIRIGLGDQKKFDWAELASSALQGGLNSPGSTENPSADAVESQIGVGQDGDAEIYGPIGGGSGISDWSSTAPSVENSWGFSSTLGESLAPQNLVANADSDGSPFAALWSSSGAGEPGFDAKAVYSQLVNAFRAAQGDISSAPGILLAANNLSEPGQPTATSDAAGDNGGYDYLRSGQDAESAIQTETNPSQLGDTQVGPGVVLGATSAYAAAVAGLGLTPTQALSLMATNSSAVNAYQGDTLSVVSTDLVTGAITWNSGAVSYPVEDPQVQVAEIPSSTGETSMGAFVRGLQGEYLGLLDPNALPAEIGNYVREAGTSLVDFGKSIVNGVNASANGVFQLGYAALSAGEWVGAFPPGASDVTVPQFPLFGVQPTLANQIGAGLGFESTMLIGPGGSGVTTGEAEVATESVAATTGEIGVPVWKSPNLLSPVQHTDAFGNEIYYRTMSPEQYQILMETGQLPPTTETSISPVLSYSSKYNGVTVQFTTAPGTSAQLQEIGIAANPPAAAQLPDLSTQTGSWMQTNVRFKVEGGQMTTQLGQGAGINIFNQNIVQFQKVP